MDDWEKEIWGFDARKKVYLQAKSEFNWLQSNNLVKNQFPYQQDTGITEYDQLIASLPN